MGVHRYRIWNGPAPTTAAFVAVTTGTTIKTMLQIATPATRMATVIGWGFTADDVPGADGVIELLEVDVAATVTAHVASGLVKLIPGVPNSLLTLGVSATGYTATVEGTPTASRVFDEVSLSSVAAEGGPFLTYRKVFENDGIPPVVDVSKFLRVRATTGTTAIDLRCFVDIEE
jgi:hypothetical protein